VKNVYFRICLVLAATGLSSLASASRFAHTCMTTNHLVSITDGPRGQLNYSSWQVKDGEPLRRAPDLTLTDGILAGGGGNYGIVFKNGEYSYSLNVFHVVEEGPFQYLKVMKGDKILLAEVCFPY
jgi:hypothetical protein